MKTAYFATFIVLVGVTTFLFGCCPARLAVTQQSDSVTTKIVERVEVVTDTVEVAIPYISESIATRDTTSHLENEYALSDAMLSGGILYHSLQTRPQIRKVEFKRPILHRDSLIIRNSFREVTVEVDRPDTWWEKTQKIGFWSMLSIILLLYLIRRVSRGGLL